MRPVLAVFAMLVLLTIIDQVPAVSSARELVPTSHRHCMCREHGPRDGCLRWTCRRQYERNRY